ncbi:MAG: glycosyltransferase family 39 protein [Oligoflexia bacterium]|nr:glycosyltransferase family 39 protein [Oligoflexia bacterium]
MNRSAGQLALLSAIFLLFCTRIFCATLLPLTDPSEARFARMAQRMLELDDWTIPRIDLKQLPDEPYLSKPPFQVWLVAGVLNSLGSSDWAVRIPSLVEACLTLILCWGFGRAYLGTNGAFLGTLILASSLGFFLLSAGLTTDIALCAEVSLALVLFYCATQMHPAHRVFSLFGCGAALGMGLLTKGPVALILFLVICGLWTLIRRRTWPLSLVQSAIIFVTALALALPWYLSAELRVPGFLRYFLIDENILRFLTHDAGVRYGSVKSRPYGTIWILLLAMMLPWSIGLVRSFIGRNRALVIKSVRDSDLLSFLLAWGLGSAVFFTFARNVLPTYVLPSLPGWALLYAGLAEQRSPAWYDMHCRRASLWAIAVLWFLVLSIYGLQCWPYLGCAGALLLIALAIREKQPAAAASLLWGLLWGSLLMALPLISEGRASSAELWHYLKRTAAAGEIDGVVGKPVRSLEFYAAGSASKKLRFVFDIVPESVEQRQLLRIIARKGDGDLMPAWVTAKFEPEARVGEWLVFRRKSL